MGGYWFMARKNEFGGSWWAKRWTFALESFGWANRLQRGRSYARAGNVLSVDVSPGMAEAKVQGSRSRPYKVQIRMKPLNESDWDRVTTAMAESAAFAASLLAGEMPENIEEAFAQCDAALFPVSEEDLATSCTCPDWANPCKHIAAVHYVLAQEFDRDPFLLFLLRGMRKEDLLISLRRKRSQAACQEASEPENTTRCTDAAAALAEDLCPSPEEFWNGDVEHLDHVAISIAPPSIDAVAIKHLGPLPLRDQGNTNLSRTFIQTMDHYYKAVTKQAITWAYGDDQEGSTAFDCNSHKDNGTVHKKSLQR